MCKVLEKKNKNNIPFQYVNQGVVFIYFIFSKTLTRL